VGSLSPTEAVQFVQQHGIVLESARGPAPSLAETIAGEPIRGSWWGHPKARQILRCSRAVRESKDVLVCRLVGGKVTYVHRDLWAALVKLQKRFNPSHLAAIREFHTQAGRHEIETVKFPEWVPPEIVKAARKVTEEEAARRLRLAALKL
jgi:hypothetical protein